MILHYSEIKIWEWNNFSPDEPNLACPCCGQFYYDIVSMDCLQTAREIIDKPIRINSGHRCAIHNARVGGVPLSQHKKIAFDINLLGHDRYEVFEACKKAGFGSFGFYKTFLHVDIRSNRNWFGKGAKGLWTGLLS